MPLFALELCNIRGPLIFLIIFPRGCFFFIFLFLVYCYVTYMVVIMYHLVSTWRCCWEGRVSRSSKVKEGYSRCNIQGQCCWNYVTVEGHNRFCVSNFSVLIFLLMVWFVIISYITECNRRWALPWCFEIMQIHWKWTGTFLCCYLLLCVCSIQKHAYLAVFDSHTLTHAHSVSSENSCLLWEMKTFNYNH